MFLKALLNVITQSTASKDILFKLLVFISNYEKKSNVVTLHSLKAKMGTEA